MSSHSRTCVPVTQVRLARLHSNKFSRVPPGSRAAAAAAAATAEEAAAAAGSSLQPVRQWLPGSVARSWPGTGSTSTAAAAAAAACVVGAG